MSAEAEGEKKQEAEELEIKVREEMSTWKV